MTEQSNFGLTSERDRLQAEIVRLRVERETGVPAELLTAATTEESARALAEKPVAVRGNPQPQPHQQQSFEPFYPVTQYRRDDLPYMTADELAQAYREGRLAQDWGTGTAPQERSATRGHIAA